MHPDQFLGKRALGIVHSTVCGVTLRLQLADLLAQRRDLFLPNMSGHPLPEGRVAHTSLAIARADSRPHLSLAICSLAMAEARCACASCSLSFSDASSDCNAECEPGAHRATMPPTLRSASTPSPAGSQSAASGAVLPWQRSRTAPARGLLLPAIAAHIKRGKVSNVVRTSWYSLMSRRRPSSRRV